MKILISPAKSLDFENKVETGYSSNPIFSEKAKYINDIIKDLSPSDLGQLMSISPKLSDLNWKRNQEFQNLNSSQKQAIYAFNGDVYDGIDISSISTDKHKKIQESVRILSGLYGILKPFDNIKPYRLEMGTKLSLNGVKNLYDFWNESVTNLIVSEVSDDELIINLASNEYFSVINSKLLNNKIISPQFKDFKNGKLKIISFYAKKARGLMTRYLIENDIKSENDLLGFDYSGYSFSPEETKDDLIPVFVR